MIVKICNIRDCKIEILTINWSIERTLKVILNHPVQFARRATGRAVIGGCEEGSESGRPALSPPRCLSLLSTRARDPERRGFTSPGRQMSGCRSRATTIAWSCSGRVALARVPSCYAS